MIIAIDFDGTLHTGGWPGIGSQADQKKFIGNAVEVTMAKVLCEALCTNLIELNIKPLRTEA